MTDKIVEDVIQLFQQRSATGIKKYGTTLEQNNTDDFIKHLQEELMDAVLYLQKIKDLSNSEIPNLSDEEINKQAEPIEEGIYRMFFKTGAKWYREQLKSKQ